MTGTTKGTMMLDGATPWPADQAAAYYRAGYWRGMPLGESFRISAAKNGPRTALVHATGRFTYTDLDSWIDRLAGGLRRDGIGAGDRVVVQLPNVPEFVAVVLALLRLGAHPVFALPAHRAREIVHLCRTAEAVAYVVPDFHAGFDHRSLAALVVREADTVQHVYVVGDPGRFAALPEVDTELGSLPEVDPDDVAFFLLSGGTTALPKMISRTHNDFEHMSWRCAEEIGVDETTVYLAALPIEYAFTWGSPGVVGVLMRGGTVVLAPDPSPHDCFELIARERVTTTSLVPTIAATWLEAVHWTKADLSSLSLVQIGGSKIRRELAELIKPVLGCALQQVYGMAEGLIICTRPEDDHEVVVSTQGMPLCSADELLVIDDSGQEVEAGKVGELFVRGPGVIRGYYRSPEHNAVAFTEEGFHRTGDLVRITEAGHVVVEGRVKDVIIRGGDKVSPLEVEEQLRAHPDVLEVAVVGMPDHDLGERVCAFIVPRGEWPTLSGLRAVLREGGLAAYKFPDRLEIVDSLPVTDLGKIDKKRLAADLAAATMGSWR